MNLEIVIPVYNALEYLGPLLGMIDNHYPDRRLVLVDDCSGEPTTTFLSGYANQRPKTMLLKRSVRGWFTRAVNTGLKYVLEKPDSERPDWVLCMNSDCTLNQGGFDELIEVWHDAEAQTGQPVGLVGAEGPRDPASSPRWVKRHEPEYVTGHAFLFSTALMRQQNLMFPWKDGQVQGFCAGQLVHIASDRALSWEFNRRHFLTIASFWAAVGHYGGKSWGHRLGDIPDPARVGD